MQLNLHICYENLYLFLGLAFAFVLRRLWIQQWGVPGFIPKGNFSNASLNGQYVYQIEGFDFSSNAQWRALSRGRSVYRQRQRQSSPASTDDFSEGGSVATTISTGTYAISNDGTGSLSLNNALGTITSGGDPGQCLQSLSDRGRLASERGRTGRKAGRDGDCRRSQPARLSSASTISTAAQSDRPAWALSPSSGGMVSNGNKDVNTGGALSSLTFTGSFNAPDSSDRARQRNFHRQFACDLQLPLLHRGCQ